jgi:hypothetical protein
MRVRFYSHKDFIENNRIMVSILGRQKGQTIILDKEESIFAMKVGNIISLKEMLNLEEKGIKSNMTRIRFLLSLCLLMFYYAILAYELFNLNLEIPRFRLNFNSGKLFPSIFLTGLTLLLTNFLSYPFSLLV